MNDRELQKKVEETFCTNESRAALTMMLAIAVASGMSNDEIVDKLKEAFEEVEKREAEEAKAEEKKSEPEAPTVDQAKKIETLTAELIKRDNSIAHWKKVAKNAKEKNESLINEKLVLEKKLSAFNAGQDSKSKRIAELEEENAALRQGIAEAQVQLWRQKSNKTPDSYDEYKRASGIPEYWLNQPNAGGTD